MGHTISQETSHDKLQGILIPTLSNHFWWSHETLGPGKGGAVGTTTPSANGLIAEIIDDEMAGVNWAPGKITSLWRVQIIKLFFVWGQKKTHLVSCWYWVSTSLLKRDRYNPLLEYRISLSLSRSSTEAEGEQKSYSIHRINYDIAINKPVVEPVCNQVCDVAHVCICIYIYIYIHMRITYANNKEAND